MKKTYVIPYVNPDTDGVCSAISYAYYLNKVKGIDAEPMVFGEIDSESRFVLSYLSKTLSPSSSLVVNPDNNYILVDTHQVNQLPSGFPLQSVVEILDHHPTGDAVAFVNAKIFNEQIGAAATLIVERIKAANLNLEADADIAQLLFAAIISNTLEFKAPTSTDRDRDAVNWLKQFFSLSAEFVDLMFKARSDIGGKNTTEVILSDFKEFDFSGTKVGMGQIETTHLDSFMQRQDIGQSLDLIRKKKGLDHILLNGADIRTQTGALISPSQNTRSILEHIVPGAKFINDVAYMDRILLRKSDLIPQLKEYFASK